MALASGFVMTDIFALRGMLVCGYTALTCFHLLHANPLRIPLRWSAIFVAVNSAMLVRLAMERWPSGLTEDDEVLRSAFFERLTPAQFVRLLALGERRTLEDGAVLTTERKPCDMLYFVERGHARLGVDGEQVSTLGRGGFVNDVAFQQGEGASAYGTVVADGRISVIAWEQAALRKVFASDEKLSSNVAHVLTSCLVEQLLQRYRREQEEQQQAAARTTNGRSAGDQAKSGRLQSLNSGDKFRFGLEGARTRANVSVPTGSSGGAGRPP